MARKFNSLGPVDKRHHYYVPREKLIDYAHNQLIGEYPEEGGHYITVWAPRQTGKTWILQEVEQRLKKDENYEVVIFSISSLKSVTSEERIIKGFVSLLELWTGKKLPKPKDWDSLPMIFTRKFFPKPLILILDEFDALENDFINQFANIFRDMYVNRNNQKDKKSHEKQYMLHGLALIGVRSVLGIENVKGSPFNVQRSVKIPNLTFDEVKHMYAEYTKETGQDIEPEVVDKVFAETSGQPGLVSWFGELLTQDYNPGDGQTITMRDWKKVWNAALHILPSNNITNLISKANTPEYRYKVLELFKTKEKEEFNFDDPAINYLYMNGVIDYEETDDNSVFYAKFSNSFVQRRLFNRFSRELFHHSGKIIDPNDMYEDVYQGDGLNIKNLVKRYETYFNANREMLLKNAPRRTDNRIYEAVFHFNFFRYLSDFLNGEAIVTPEFPTGNGKIDLLVKFNDLLYGIELKSFSKWSFFPIYMKRAAQYGSQLGLAQINLLVFIENLNDDIRKKKEIDYVDEETGVKVIPAFVSLEI